MEVGNKSLNALVFIILETAISLVEFYPKEKIRRLQNETQSLKHHYKLFLKNG